MIKTIAIDMDGTLLNSGQRVSEENKQAIKQAQESGVEVLIATGRSYQEARFALDETGILCPIISVNGAAVFTPAGQIAASHPMSVQSVRRAAGFLEDEGIYFEVYTNEGLYSKNYEMAVSALVDIFISANPKADPDLVKKNAESRLKMGYVKSVSRFEEIFDNPDMEFYKLLCFSLNEEKLEKASTWCSGLQGITVTSSGRENIEISSIEAQKGLALEKYVQQKNGSMKETMAIGDNFNDVSMFKKAGLSVAMGNAPQEIQQLCDEVTATNNENGVAQAILKVLNGRGM